jgi:hypothetical protein
VLTYIHCMYSAKTEGNRPFRTSEVVGHVVIVSRGVAPLWRFGTCRQCRVCIADQIGMGRFSGPFDEPGREWNSTSTISIMWKL